MVYRVVDISYDCGVVCESTLFKSNVVGDCVAFIRARCNDYTPSIRAQAYRLGIKDSAGDVINTHQQPIRAVA